MSTKKFIWLLIVINFNIYVTNAQWKSCNIKLDYAIRTFYTDSINNRLLVGGNFFKIGNDTIGSFGIFDGDSLKPLNELMNAYDILSTVIYNNKIIVGGYFPSLNGDSTTKNISEWENNHWQKIGDGINGAVYSVRVIDNELYATGTFNSNNNGTIVANGLAKFNGTNWEGVYNLPQFDTIPGNVNMIFSVCKYNNEIYVAGNFNTNDLTIRDIVKFNGAIWIDVGGSMKGSWSDINKMVVYNGKLVVAGMFYKKDGNAGNFIMTWDGQQWEELGGGTWGIYGNLGTLGTIYDMLVYKNKLYICGLFNYAGSTPASHVAVWDGVKWCGYSGVFDNTVNAMTIFNDTIYIAPGQTINGDTVNYFAKWSRGLEPDTCGFVGIQENYLSEKINIYPNPSQESIFVNNIKLQTDYEIYNQLGEKVLEGKYNSKGINIKSLSKGLYLIRLKVNKDTYSSTFIKQ